jgi:hypothetical protein
VIEPASYSLCTLLRVHELVDFIEKSHALKLAQQDSKDLTEGGLREEGNLISMVQLTLINFRQTNTAGNEAADEAQVEMAAEYAGTEIAKTYSSLVLH